MDEIDLAASATYDVNEQLDEEIEGDGDDEDRAPIKWKPDPTNRALQWNQFLQYYKSRGFKIVSHPKYPMQRFQTRPFLINGEPLTQFVQKPVRNGEFGGDGWEHCPTIKTGPMSGPAPFPVFVPFVRPDNEEHVTTFDERQTQVAVFDKNCPDPAKETLRRFGRGIELMKKTGAIPKDWQGGVWGPVAKGFDEPLDNNWGDEVEEDLAAGVPDAMATSTFHGFVPRLHRPNRFSLGHKGYDNLYLKQRDGEAFNSADAPVGEWVDLLGSDIPMSSPTEKEIIKNALERGNPATPTARAHAVKPARQVLEENESRNAGNKARGGASAPRARGGASAPRARGGWGGFTNSSGHASGSGW